MNTERLSELLFGRTLRLDVALWIVNCNSGRFFQLEIAEHLASRFRSSVASELDRFVQAGLLEVEAPTPGERRKFYVRTSSSLWEIFETADKVLRNFTYVDSDALGIRTSNASKPESA